MGIPLWLPSIRAKNEQRLWGDIKYVLLKKLDREKPMRGEPNKEGEKASGKEKNWGIIFRRKFC